MPHDQALQPQINELKGRVDSIEGQLDKLNLDLRGTMDNPGVFEIIRSTNKSLRDLTIKTDTVISTLAEFKVKEAKVIGGSLVLKVMLLGGGTLIGWALTHMGGK